ncbi:MAG: MTH1187 family thiamine-binding protein [Candidatus Altiarchaeota archaeon]|nr:MTH1187 family thiamine-binding protein [Candidatus Altiarchaeota archaeon]
MIIAEISVVPLGTKTPSVGSYVRKAVDKLRKMGLKPELTAMGTVFEAEDIEVILKAYKAVHESVFKEGACRVITTLRIDERRDKEGSIRQKIKSISPDR